MSLEARIIEEEPIDQTAGLLDKSETFICFVLLQHSVETLTECLCFLAKSSKSMKIILVENRSHHTETSIKPFIFELLKLGLVWKYYVFDQNLQRYALNAVLNLANENALELNSFSYTIITDDDIILQTKTDILQTGSDIKWWEEEASILFNCPEVFACGAQLSMFPDQSEEIYVTPKELTLYKEGFTNTRLLMFRTADLLSVLKELNQYMNASLTASTLQQICKRRNQIWAQTKTNLFNPLIDEQRQDNNRYTNFSDRRSSLSVQRTTSCYSLFECDPMNRRIIKTTGQSPVSHSSHSSQSSGLSPFSYIGQPQAGQENATTINNIQQSVNPTSELPLSVLRNPDAIDTKTKYTNPDLNSASSESIRQHLVQVIQQSCSNELLKQISSTMAGQTFHHHTHLLYDLRTLLGSSSKVYTEIGTYHGGSVCLMMQHPYPTTLYVIDPFIAEPKQRETFDKNIGSYNTYNKPIQVYSQYSTDAKLVQQLRGKSFRTDILLIDGDHSAIGVRSDFDLFHDFVNAGGFIVFGDYLDSVHSPDVKPAVDQIIEYIQIFSLPFVIIGSIPNVKQAYSSVVPNNYSNAFILQKSL